MEPSRFRKIYRTETSLQSRSLEGLPMNDFSASTVAALARKGITLVGLTTIPSMSSDMPFATGDRGYRVNDNDCGRVWTFSQVLEAAR